MAHTENQKEATIGRQDNTQIIIRRYEKATLGNMSKGNATNKRIKKATQ